jgi:hypothetical protein
MPVLGVGRDYWIKKTTYKINEDQSWALPKFSRQAGPERQVDCYPIEVLSDEGDEDTVRRMALMYGYILGDIWS